MEYIYVLDIAWVNGTLESVPIKENSIVCDVFLGEDRYYHFKVKETGQIFYCYYDWAFRENTAENLKAIQIYDAKLKELEIIKKECDRLHEKIKTLRRAKEKP